jgi:anti-anti-sigma factor
MEISIRRVNNITVFDLTGELIMGKPVEGLGVRIREELDSGTKRFAVNLERVKYIDSYGAGVILAAHNAATQAGARCHFFGAPPRVMAILTVVHLDKVLNLFPDEASAVSNVLGKEPSTGAA